MSITTPTEVAALLRQPGLLDETLEPHIATAERRIARAIRRTFSSLAVPAVEDFYTVRADDRLHLADVAPTVASVQRVDGESPAEQLSDLEYWLVPHGAIVLRFSGVYGREVVPVYDRVRVSYTTSTAVPEELKRAIEYLAASYYSQVALDVSAAQSETTEGYSFTKSDEDGRLPKIVRDLIREYRRPRVRLL